MTDLTGKRVLVVGLARSGRAAVVCLAKRGARVTVTDLKPPATFKQEIAELMPYKVGLELGAHREETFLAQDLIVASPGAPWDMPQLVKARERGIRVIPEIELASWFLTQPILGITGSNGKTTTTTLIGKMLEASGFRTFVGGNIGVPLISAVDADPPPDWLVTELSSFQLEGIEKFRPRVAALLNLSRNHLDRHANFEAYVAAKARIFSNQGADDYAVLNADDENVMRLAPSIAARKIFFSMRQNLPDGVFVSKGELRYRAGNLERTLMELSEIPLRGAYNIENVAAAAAVVATVGADFDALRAAVKQFRGVEHRLEFVRKIQKVQFFNDSKATSVDATAKSLSAFEGGVHLIMGGKDKGAPYTPLRPLVTKRAREVLVIGAAAEKIVKDLSGAAEIVHAGTLETAVREAFMRAVPGEVVLLAPACSSYDQFQDFEHRGRVFKELVEKLGQDVEALPLRLEPRALPPIETDQSNFEAHGPEPQERAAIAADPRPKVSQEALRAGATPPAGTGAVRAAAAGPAAPGPATSKSAKDNSPRPNGSPWHYVYEVEREEFPPSPEEFSQEPESVEAAVEEAERPPEELTDASMPFEVREGARPSSRSKAPGESV
jgi:UDP-N-acetylmuramoylalanine--D-glutamate ligase